MDEQCASQNGLSVLPLEICCLISKYVDCNLPSERPDQRRRPSGGREFSRASRASSRAAYEVRTRYVIFLFYLYISFCFMLFLFFFSCYLFFSFLSFPFSYYLLCHLFKHDFVSFSCYVFSDVLLFI